MARQEAARQEASRQEAARQAREAEDRRLAAEAEARKAAEERARQQAATLDKLRAEQAKVSPPSVPADSSRRRTLFGRTDEDPQVAIFQEVWRRNVNARAPFEILAKAKTGSYQNPWVTVALRPDGQVESVTFDRTSGVQEIDAAVRQIIMMLAPYNRFPRELASEYDVIEIPAVWTFNRAVRLYWGGG
jgi:outer membrane biosynthesis protein TonB